MTGVSDEELMLRVVDGDMHALGVLFERYHRSVHRFLTRVLRCSSLAEDVLQDAFLRVYDRRQSYRSPHKFSTWLFTIAYRMAIDTLRRGERTEMLGALTDDLRDIAPSPAESVERDEYAQVVRDAITALPEDQRITIMLREYEGFSYREIAEITHTTERAARVRGFRARQALAVSLAALHGVAEVCADDAVTDNSEMPPVLHS